MEQENSIVVIQDDQIEQVVSNQFDVITIIDTQIQQATEMCQKSQELVQQLGSKKLSKEQQQNANHQAVRSLAEAQISLAEAQKMLFENQQKMTDALKFLFTIGTQSVAQNKMVIEQLENKLQLASKEKLSQNAYNELLGVIQLLRDQESVLTKQERIAKQIGEIKNVDNRQDKKDVEQDDLLHQSAEQDLEHDKQIELLNKIVSKQTKWLIGLSIGLGVIVAIVIVALILVIN